MIIFFRRRKKNEIKEKEIQIAGQWQGPHTRSIIEILQTTIKIFQFCVDMDMEFFFPFFRVNLRSIQQWLQEFFF